MDCQNFQRNGNMVRIPQESSFGKRQHLSVCFLFVLLYCMSFLFVVESHAQNVDTFEISVGQTIGADQPVLGSGHIEEEGGQDIYLFEGKAGQTVFLEMLAHEVSFRQMIWTVTGPDGKILALECFRCQDPGYIKLTRTGKHQIVVGNTSLTETGVYSFSLLHVPEPDVFQLQFGVSVSPDSPAIGAGRIESPGASDKYQFEVQEGQRFIFRLLSFNSSLDSVNWRLQSPTLGTLYFGDLIQYQPRIFTLETSGVFDLIIGDKNNPATGEYEFVLESIPPPDEIHLSVKDPIEIFNDGNGAGLIQSSAAQDVYHWSMDAPGWIFLDLKEADKRLQFAQWELYGPSNQKIFSKFFFSDDPGLIFLEDVGDYRMIIGGNLNSGTGDYRIHIQPVPSREVFDLTIGEEVKSNQPEEGAGIISVPGAQDVYHFHAEPGQEIFVEVLQSERSLGFLTWQLVDDSGTVLFDECLRCLNPGKITLQKGGDYQLLVGGFQHAGTGAYSFHVWDVPEPQAFEIESGGFSILPDQPAAGAGRLESPGARDFYQIKGVKGQVWHLKPTLATRSQTLKWRLTAPDGLELFDTAFRATESNAQFLSLFQSGNYLLEFYKPSSSSSNYGFDFSSVDGCNPDALGSQLPLPELTIALPVSGEIVSSSKLSVQGAIGLNSGSQGMDLMLVLDSSESLRKNDPDDLRQRAVSEFVASLPQGLNIRLGLVDFDHNAKLLQPLTENFDSVLTQLETLDQSGGTDIQQALEISMEEIVEKMRVGVAQNIILFSDGESSEGSPADAAFISRELGVKTHTVYLGESLSAGSLLLKSISDATCANFRHAKSASELADIFRNIANPIPIDRMELISSVDPDVIYPVSFVGQFWQANDVGISTDPGSTSLLTVRLFTDEATPRIVEQFVELQYQEVPNQSPILAPIRNRTMFEDGMTTVKLDVSDPDHASDTLIWSFESDRPDIIANENGLKLLRNGDLFELELIPAPDAFGVVNINAMVKDPDGAMSQDTFRLSIRPKNDRPSLNQIDDLVLNPGEAVRSVALTGISDGSHWEDQSLEFSVLVADTSIISAVEILYDQGDVEGEVQLTSVPDADGVTEISITLSDRQGANHSITRVFQVTVLPEINELPSISWIEPSDYLTFFEGETIMLKVSALDPEGGINRITFYANGKPVTPPSNTSQEVQWDPSHLGTWQLHAEIEDDKTASAETPTITVEIIERPPEFSISIQSPADQFVACMGETIEIGVSLEGGAPEGTVVYLFAGDQLKGVRNTQPYLFQWDVQEMGDFLITAHAFREDGSVIQSEPIRAGISDTCRQVALITSGKPVEDPLIIQELLFEMGAGMTLLSAADLNVDLLKSFDLVLGIEDSELGVTSQLLESLRTAYVDFELPIFILGHRLASRTDSLSRDEGDRWRELTHLQFIGGEWGGDFFELQERGFFKSILNGRFGMVESFELPVSLDRAFAEESAEVIAFTGESDTFIRYPAGTEPDFDQPRKIIQNFPLIDGGDAHSVAQRKRLFQNAICWLLRCSACSSVHLQVSPGAWNQAVESGELVRQSFHIVNNGICESTAGRVLIDIPPGVTVEDVEMSKGLGWKRELDGHRVSLNLGRLPAGEEDGVDVQLLLRSLTPGEYSFLICSESINTEPVCIEQPLSVKGLPMLPPRISIARGNTGNLLLVIKGQQGMRYRVESSSDFQTWEFLGAASGIETGIPLPTNQDGVPLNLFYRASIAL
ncbi:MAG: hypothetical protein CMI66_14550 [Pedosphaera sp.]|nr:hypothetical protein [Pedosphaera sp.]